MPEPAGNITRRRLLGDYLRGACLIGTGAGAVLLAKDAKAEDMVWQIDPHKCVACKRCQKQCVLTLSAVKCAHNHKICGYCEGCFGYYNNALPGDMSDKIGTGAENQLCPTGAVVRTEVTADAFCYTIDESLCIGCGLCVRGCALEGNGSLHLQIRHDRCLNCNQCGIASACPVGAVIRVPASSPYILKELEHGGEKS